MAIQRAEDKTAQMQARAGAIDELIASGALDDASSLNRGDDIARELEAMSSQSDVEAELAAPQGRHRRPQAIEAGRRRRRRSSRPSPRPAAAGRRRTARHDRPDPRRGSVRRLRRRSSTALNELDATVEAAVEAGDEAAFARGPGRAARRRTHGRGSRTPTESLDDSDLILPPADATHRRGARAARATTG